MSTLDFNLSGLVTLGAADDAAVCGPDGCAPATEEDSAAADDPDRCCKEA